MSTLNLQIEDIKIIINALTYLADTSSNPYLTKMSQQIMENINSQITVVENSVITDSFTRTF